MKYRGIPCTLHRLGVVLPNLRRQATPDVLMNERHELMKVGVSPTCRIIDHEFQGGPLATQIRREQAVKLANKLLVRKALPHTVLEGHAPPLCHVLRICNLQPLPTVMIPESRSFIIAKRTAPESIPWWDLTYASMIEAALGFSADRMKARRSS